jgi:hypothetical protein
MAESNQWVLSGETKTISYIANAAGILVGQVRRLQKPKRLNDGDPASHYATDAEWQSIIDLIAAAPEMLKVLKKAQYVCFDDRTEVLEYFRSVQAVIAKAEPPSTVKHTVLVQVTVEVEADAGTHPEAIRNRAFDSVYTGGGVGVEFKAKEIVRDED